jgi:hypothetical protein
MPLMISTETIVVSSLWSDMAIVDIILEHVEKGKRG